MTDTSLPALFATASPARNIRDITGLLHAWRGGDAEALERLTTLVYRHLHALARQYMRRENPGHTLSATALVHEAYLQLCGANVPWEDRAHFFAVAARIMRHILVSHAIAARRIKRGGGKGNRISLQESVSGSPLAVSIGNPEILDLDRALERLLRQDERKGRLVEMVYFAGLKCDEAAEVLDVSVTTVNRDLKFARAWLLEELKGSATQR